METVDCLVVGAGVVGLASARALALAGREVLIVETERLIGSGISSRNSEVIHSGLYYPPGSLKARLCVRGRALLYGFCETRGVPHRRCGKLIVSSDAAQDTELEAIALKAAGNGVDDIRRLSAAQARAMEPALTCTGALLSPSTGILDTHAYMLSLLGEAEDHGAMLARETGVADGAMETEGVSLRFDDGSTALHARLVVNAAGLDAPALAGRIEGGPPPPGAHYAKGSYFSLSGPAPFKRLIYPVPEPGGLGVHLTLDLAGQARFGPDVEWIEAANYDVDPRRSERFYAAVRRYWPALRDGALQPAYAGVRPKIVGPGQGEADFVIEAVPSSSSGGAIHLFGIESPGITASLAIAEVVAARAAEMLDG